MTRAWIIPVWLVAAQPLAAQATAEPITLERAIALAQQQSPAARTAASALEVARWQARGFDAQQLPQVRLSGQVPSFSRRIQEVIQPDGSPRFVGRSQTSSSLSLNVQQQIPFTGGQLSFSSHLSRIGYNESNTELWSSSPLVVGLQQPLFRLNAAAWNARAQTLTSLVAERQYLESMEDVASQTVTAFFSAFQAQASLRNARGNAAINDSLYSLNRGRYEVGKIGEDDLLQSELALLRARTATDQAGLAFERALSTFKVQLGVPQEADITLVPPTGIPQVEVDTALAMRAALRNGSATTSRDLQLLQAERSVREAKLSSGFGATITAQVGYNQTGDAFRDAYQSLLGQQQVAVGVEVPLIQWGAGKARVEMARAGLENAKYAAQRAEEQQRQDAYFAARELMQLEGQMKLLAKADTVATKRFEVAANRYRIGKIDGTSLFNAQSEKDQALQAYVQQLGTYWAAYYRLRRLTLYDFATKREIRSAGGAQ